MNAGRNNTDSEFKSKDKTEEKTNAHNAVNRSRGLRRSFHLQRLGGGGGRVQCNWNM